MPSPSTRSAQGGYRLRAIQDGVELATLEDASAGDDVRLRGERIAHGPDLVIEVDGAMADVHVDGGPFRDARTDMEGRVRADDVMPGHYALRLRPHGGQAVTVHELDLAEAELAVTDAPPVVVRVDLGDPAGEATGRR